MGFQITNSCLFSENYGNEVALKIDTVKDRGVSEGGGSRTPGTPPGYPPGVLVLIYLKSIVIDVMAAEFA